MKVKRIRANPHLKSKSDGIVQTVIKFLEPEACALIFPSWMKPEDENVKFFEKRNTLIIGYFIDTAANAEDLTRLFQTKKHWSQFLEARNSMNKVILYLIGEKIQPHHHQFISMERDIKIVEFYYVEEEDTLYVKEEKRNDPASFVMNQETSAAPGERKAMDPGQPSQDQKKVSGIKIAPPEQEDLNPAPAKHDYTLSSFFYKMGRFSEEELSRFLELEKELKQIRN